MAKRTPRIVMLLTVLALLRAGFSIGPATAQNEIGEGQSQEAVQGRAADQTRANVRGR